MKDSSSELTKKDPRGSALGSSNLNSNIISQIRQVLLDLLTEYKELDFPANPDLLKLHIEVSEDKLLALIAQDRQELLKRIELPEKRTDGDKEWIYTKDEERGYNQALSEVQAIINAIREG